MSCARCAAFVSGVLAGFISFSRVRLFGKCRVSPKEMPLPEPKPQVRAANHHYFILYRQFYADLHGKSLFELREALAKCWRTDVSGARTDAITDHLIEKGDVPPIYDSHGRRWAQRNARKP